MMKNLLSIFLAITMIVSTSVIAFGQSNDYETNWAKTEIGYMINKEILSGYPDGTFKPTNKMTKAEFYKTINALMGFSEKSESKYSDVKSDDWFYSEVQKAIKADYLLPTKLLNANENITRGEVARIIATVFGIEKNETIANEFKDSKTLPSEIKGLVGGLKENAYISGYPDGTFRYISEISRAEVAKMLYNISGKIANQDEVINKDIKTNILVNKPNVVLKDIKIKGNLYLTEGVGEGDVTLDNVIVKGELIIRSGGENSIKIKNSKIDKALINKQEGLVRVIFENTTVEQLDIKKQAKIELIKGTLIKSVELDGKSQISLEKGTTIEKLNSINKEAIVDAKGNINSIKTMIGIKINGKTVKPNTDYKVKDGSLQDTKPASSQQGSSSGSDYDYSDDTVEVSSISLTPISLNLEVGGVSERIIETISPSYATNKNIIWLSSDENVAKVSNGTVTPISAGKATITAISASNSNINAKCDVTVVGINYEKSYKVNFDVEENGTLLATVDDEDITNGSNVISGKIIKFIVRPESEYKVKNWILNGQIVEDNKTNILTITSTRDVMVTVEFEEDEKEILEGITGGTYRNTPQDNKYIQGTESQTYVGLGYNILEKAYFEPSKFERGFNILDKEKVQNFIEKSPKITENANRYIEGRDLESYNNKLATKMNLSANYPVFSGSIKAEYNMEKTKQSNVHFIKQMNGYIDHSEYLPNSVELKSMLDETFKKELEDITVSPEKLFRRYGTHLLREALMGARCTYNYTYSSESEESSSEVKMKIDAAYKFLSGELSGQDKENAKKFVESSDFYSVLIGGKYIDASTLGKLTENFPDWVATLRDYPPDIYGVSSINSLVPIWELTDNVERAKELEKYFDESGAILSDWLKEQSKIPDKPSTKEYIESIIITSDKDKEKAKDDSIYGKKENYERIDKDLNAGAGGDYIYMWYKTTTDPNNALYDIRFTYDNFSEIPNIYTKNNHDLNEGAGGAYIYMWTSKKPKMPGDKPITAINIFNGKNADMPSGYKASQADWYEKGHKSGTAELNRGTKKFGDYIYLGYTTK